ncbi:HEAT repeat domain-containing protein [Coleofasciculus sp. E2-BRE-01]|uniref:HEAT repeat domain-containing protein n=1 Tax=Coleofasciculus sp. E2-BRE-01 TaxID=3069524 RepID=UPI0032FB4E9A
MSYYGLDQLRESMVKILNPDKGETAGSGFIIRSDGYLITCHHVIYLLDRLIVEYQGQEYEAQWCQALSNPDVDIAILKITIENAPAVPIINPQHLSTSVTVYGFPPSQKKYFPEGINFSAPTIRSSAPVNILPTYRIQTVTATNPWNRLPQEQSTFVSHRIDTKVDSGTSGGAVFAEELGGVVGVIQCSKSDESYLIRWDNCLESLNALGLEPEKNAVCQFLEAIENDQRFKSIGFFHTPQNVVLQEQYIPIQVTLERKYKHEVETSWGYGESEAEIKRVYALKGGVEEVEESRQTQVDWQEAKKDHSRVMVLADPGMGKSTLLKMEAGLIAKQERENLTPHPPRSPLEGGMDKEDQYSPIRSSITPLLKGGRGDQKALDKTSTVDLNKVEILGIDDVIFPLFLRLSDLDETPQEIIDAIPQLIQRDYPKNYPAIDTLLQEKLENGKCYLLLDALDEVPKQNRTRLAEKLNRFARNYNCPMICTSRIVGYGGAFLPDAKEVEIVPFSQKQTEAYIQTWFKNAAGYLEDDSVSAEGLIEELRHKPQIGGLAQNPLLLSLLCSLYQVKGLTLPARRTQVYGKAVDYMLGKWGIDNHRQWVNEARVSAKKELLQELAYQFSSENKEIFSIDELRRKIENYLGSEQVCSDFKPLSAASLIEELSENDGIIQLLDRGGDRYLFLHRTFQEYLTAAYLSRVGNGVALARQHFWDYDWHETLSLLAGLMADPIPLLQVIMKEKDDIFKTLLLLAGRCLAECSECSHPLVTKVIDRLYKFWLSYPSVGFITSTLVALSQVNSQMVQKWQAALNHSDSYLRREAAEALGKIGNTQAVEGLIAALHDSDSYVRWEAAVALAKIGNPQAVDSLIATLHNSNRDMRWNAAEALGKIGDAQAVDSLIAALNHSHREVRRYGAVVLGTIGNTQAVDGLVAALHDSDRDVRWNAAKSLGEIGNAKAVDSLIAALHDSHSDVRWNAAVALGEIGNPQAVDSLIAALNDSESYVRWNAAEALGEIGNPQAVEGLIAALNDSDSYVRRSAAFALAKIGNTQAVEGLIAALHDSDRNVRMEAAFALGKIGNAEILAKLIKYLDINIYDNDIFPLARTLAVRYSKENLPFIPVYPKLVRFSYSPILATVKRRWRLLRQKAREKRSTG